MLTVTDQFCGAGGSSIGAAEVSGIDLRLGMNHWKVACETYGSNHREADVVCADIMTTDPRRFGRTDILLTSPECTNHSMAKSRPATPSPQGQLWSPKDEEERSRATMWDVPRFAEHHEYKVIVVENVVEAAKWVLFEPWLLAMQKLDYECQAVYVNSMIGHPTPQSRDRLYYVFWKRGQRKPNLEFTPPAWCSNCEKVVAADQVFRTRTKAWPMEYWGRYRAQYDYCCPVCKQRVDLVVYPAYTAIDWSIEGQRIGDRSDALKPATMARIRKGLERFHDLPPMLIPVDGRERKDQSRPLWGVFPTQTGRLETGLVMRGGVVTNRGDASHYNSAMNPLDHELRTVVAGGNHHMVVTDGKPFMVQLEHSGSDRKYDGTRVRGVDEVMPTATASTVGSAVVTQGSPIIVQVGGHTFEREGYVRAWPVSDPLVTMTADPLHAVAIPPTFVVKNFGQGDDPSMAKSIEEHLGAVTTQDHHSIVTMPQPFLTSYYGSGGETPVSQPVNTVPTKDRHALVEPSDVSIEDCRFRMLEPHEIGKAMAFPETYKVVGNKRQRVRQYGNAVTPPIMKMLVERCVESLS